MTKQLLLAMAVAFAATTGSAQDNETTVVDANTTAAAAATTGAVNLREGLDNDTTGTAAVPPQFSEEQFERRWETESRMYREAGISEEKIKRLHDITQKTWNARARGEKLDFQELGRQRSEILDQEDMQKLREVRRKAISDRINDNKDTNSTSPQTQ